MVGLLFGGRLRRERRRHPAVAADGGLGGGAAEVPRPLSARTQRQGLLTTKRDGPRLVGTMT